MNVRGIYSALLQKFQFIYTRFDIHKTIYVSKFVIV